MWFNFWFVLLYEAKVQYFLAQWRIGYVAMPPLLGLHKFFLPRNNAETVLVKMSIGCSRSYVCCEEKPRRTLKIRYWEILGRLGGRDLPTLPTLHIRFDPLVPL